MPIDYSQYIRASDGSGEAVRAIVTSPRTVGDMDLIVDSVLNWPNKFIATSGDLDVDTGLFDPDSISIFYATLSGSIIVIDEFAPGYSDVGHTTGQTVLLKPTTAWADAVAEGGGGGASVTIGDTPPATPEQGDLWGDTNGGEPGLVQAVAELLMPVGHILITGSSTNPATTYGFGTWVRIQGKFIIGVDDSDSDFDLNDTGGAKTHTLTIGEIPNRTGTITAHSSRSSFWAPTGVFSGTSMASTYSPPSASTSGANSVNVLHFNLGGGGGAHDIMNPYIAKYIWERTA